MQCILVTFPCNCCFLQDKELVVFKPDAEFASVYDSCMGVHSTQKEVYTQLQGAHGTSFFWNGTLIYSFLTGTLGPKLMERANSAHLIRYLFYVILAA